MDDEEAYREARRRANAKIGVHIHAAAYIVVNALLFAINLLTSENAWFIWPLMGWAVGLFFHALLVYAFLDGSRIKERMVERELKKISADKQ